MDAAIAPIRRWAPASGDRHPGSGDNGRRRPRPDPRASATWAQLTRTRSVYVGTSASSGTCSAAVGQLTVTSAAFRVRRASCTHAHANSAIG